ncbi:MAG: hypothetical protein FJZ89_11945, partial [Chloroflexi bacterium]|nr:hypothetical protein [Chloroflexota bacterium]
MYWGIRSAIPLIALVCYAALLWVTARHGLRKAINRFFALYLLSILVWSFGAVMMYLDPQRILFWNRVMLSGLVGMPLTFFAFVRGFLRLERRPWLLPLGGVALVALWVCNALGYLTSYIHFIENGLLAYQFGPAFPFFAANSALFLGLAAFSLIGAYRKTRDPIEKNRLRYAFLGISAIILGSSTNLIPALGAYPIDIAANIVNALLLAYAISRYQLLDITIVIRKGLLYTIPAAVIGTIYFLIVYLVVNLFRTITEYQILLLALVVAAVTAVVVQPLRDKAQYWLDKLFFREKYDSALMLQRLSHVVASILDADALTSMVFDEITTTMHIGRAVFFFREEESGWFYLAAQRGLKDDGDLRLRKDHPLVGWLSSHERALTRHDAEVLPQFQALWEQERQDLQRIEAELFIPLRAKGKLVGIFAVGPKLSEETYSPDDQITLATLANQTAIAIENARLYAAAQQELAERKRAEEQTKATLAEKEMLLREVHHRVKNNLQAIIALISMQTEQIGDARITQSLQELQERAYAMALVYEQLYQSENLAQIPIQPYLQNLSAHVFQAFGGGRAIKLSVEAAPVSLDVE